MFSRKHVMSSISQWLAVGNSSLSIASIRCSPVERVRGTSYHSNIAHLSSNRVQCFE